MTNQEEEKRVRYRWQIKDILELTSLIIASVSLIFAYAAFRTSDKTQHQLKNMDVLADFQKRYDHIAYDVKGAATNEVQALEYYHRFWDLLGEEFRAWNDGSIDTVTFSSWMKFRHREWTNNSPEGHEPTISYKDGWNKTTNYLAEPQFTWFMEQVFNGRHEEVYTNPPPHWLHLYKDSHPNGP